MAKPNRDLLIMLKHERFSPEALEQEVMFLHEILFEAERISRVTAAYEIIDLIQYRVTNKAERIKRHIREKKFRPFIFLMNRN